MTTKAKQAEAQAKAEQETGDDKEPPAPTLNDMLKAQRDIAARESTTTEAKIKALIDADKKKAK